MSPRGGGCPGCGGGYRKAPVNRTAASPRSDLFAPSGSPSAPEGAGPPRKGDMKKVRLYGDGGRGGAFGFDQVAREEVEGGAQGFAGFEAELAADAVEAGFGEGDREELLEDLPGFLAAA